MGASGWKNGNFRKNFIIRKKILGNLGSIYPTVDHIFIKFDNQINSPEKSPTRKSNIFSGRI